MTDRTHPVHGAVLSRRRMLALCAGAVALPPVLGACTAGPVDDADPVALLALADQARADAALAGAAVIADPGPAGSLEPLRAARTEHAAALDAAGRRTPPPTAPSGPEPVDRNRVREAVVTSARAAAEAAAVARPDQVGLLAGVFACCAAYSDGASLGDIRVPDQGSGELSSPRVAVEALQRALAGEHAAIWAYTLALAFVPPDQAARARADIEAHKTLRSTVTEALSQQGERPVSAQPSYTPPQPVLDAVSAGALLVAAESDTTAALRSLVERASTAKLRITGLGWMAESTGRSAFWRAVTDRAPAIPVFPGRG